MNKLDRLIEKAKDLEASNCLIRFFSGFHTKEELIAGFELGKSHIIWVRWKMPDLFESIREQHQDENGNLFCCRCIDCSDCVLCFDCISCKGCINCQDCINCNNCNGCQDCINCQDCEDCTACFNCEKCTYCVYCEYLRDGNEVTDY